MKRLSAYEVHKLIKKYVPFVRTYWERNEKAHQITIDEWIESENMLKEEEPQLFCSFMANIERKK